jgi:hypothetical protein
MNNKRKMKKKINKVNLKKKKRSVESPWPQDNYLGALNSILRFGFVPQSLKLIL